MRRTFLRIPSSPQATPFVETPAHYTPTLFMEFGSYIQGGEWECQSPICLLIKSRGKDTNNIGNNKEFQGEIEKYASRLVILCSTRCKLMLRDVSFCAPRHMKRCFRACDFVLRADTAANLFNHDGAYF